MKKIISALLLSALLVSCNSNENSGETDSKPPHADVEWHKVELDSAVREHLPIPEIESYSLNKTVQQNGDLLAEFDIKSQTLKKDTLGLQIINLEVNEWLRSNFYINKEDYKEKNLDSLIARYEAFLKAEAEMMSLGSNFEIHANASVVFNKNGLMNYDLSVYSYTGGAHGNANTILRTYDIVSGKRLELTDMFQDTVSLKSKMNEVFNATMPDEIKSDIYVDEIPLTNNIQLAKDTLLFYFNAYEIGPYSMGPVELKIATKDLKDNLKLKLD
ncbi:MAG: DUF4163 domain-containing protein [Crocinitomicaceae bacterium]|nr:DUF4163 domain-containing protein [Crocinitomicaceae bacterium]